VGQVAGEPVDVGDELAAADEPEVQPAEVAHHRDVQPLTVGDHRDRVVRQHLDAARIDRHVRARHVGDGDVERRQPVEQAGG
jgi:hypothetical protein